MKPLGQKVLGTFLLSILSLIVMTLPSKAIPLSTVGNIDNFLGFCNGIPASDANEIACIEGFSGIGSVSAIQKFGPTAGDGVLEWNLQTIDGQPNTAAFLLPEAWRGSHFLLKTGNLTPGNSGPTIYSYIFENLSSSAYAVFNFDDTDYPINIGQIGKISHLTAVQLVATPLPAAIWMFVAALGGLFGMRRFRRS